VELCNTSCCLALHPNIYAENVFYIDGASEHNYKDIIKNWLEEKKVDCQKFRYEIKNMQNTMIEDVQTGKTLHINISES
jgi:hypothetical protein